jgi:hypothetical protein
MHGFVGFDIACMVAPIMHKFFFKRLMLTSDGSFKDKGELAAELEKRRTSL